MFTEVLAGRTWQSPDEMASEVEVGEFLYGLVRLVKPQVVVETGCYKGDASEAIAEGLRDNGGYGYLLTCDTDQQMVLATWKRVEKFGNTRVDLGTSMELISHLGSQPNLAFLDSSGDRVAEALALKDKLAPHGLIVLHDARRDTLAEIIARTGWRHVFLPTPRGLAILQAPETTVETGA